MEWNVSLPFFLGLPSWPCFFAPEVASLDTIGYSLPELFQWPFCGGCSEAVRWGLAKCEALFSFILGLPKEAMRAFKMFIVYGDAWSLCSECRGGLGKRGGPWERHLKDRRTYPCIPSLRAVEGFRVYPGFWGSKDKLGSYSVSPREAYFQPGFVLTSDYHAVYVKCSAKGGPDPIGWLQTQALGLFRKIRRASQRGTGEGSLGAGESVQRDGASEQLETKFSMAVR